MSNRVSTSGQFVRREHPSFRPPTSVLVLPAGEHANRKLTLVVPAMGVETGHGEVPAGTYTFTYKFRTAAPARPVTPADDRAGADDQARADDRAPATSVAPPPAAEAMNPAAQVPVDVACKVNALAVALGCVVREDSTRPRCTD